MLPLELRIQATAVYFIAPRQRRILLLSNDARPVLRENLSGSVCLVLDEVWVNTRGKTALVRTGP